jgi:hypothetical protein
MARWKAAGPAPRDVDELLWKTVPGAQDRFFMAKQAALVEQDTEFGSTRKRRKSSWPRRGAVAGP